MKADPLNIALVLLVFVNAVAVVQFGALARTNPMGTSKITTIEIARSQISAAIRQRF